MTQATQPAAAADDQARAKLHGVTDNASPAAVTAHPMSIEEVPVDGRTARGLRTRAAVVDALLALMQEGELAPTAQRVAARAGVAPRTVYGHFADLESLRAEASERELERLDAMLEPVDPSLPLAARVERYCSGQSRLLEALLPVARSARLYEHASPALQASRRRYVALHDVRLREAFTRELEGRQTLLDDLYLATGGPAWDALRHDRGLEPAAAAEVMRRTVSSILAE